jgi:hypothetical protein
MSEKKPQPKPQQKQFVPYINRELRTHKRDDMHSVQYIKPMTGCPAGTVRGYRLEKAAALTRGLSQDDLASVSDLRKWPIAVLRDKDRFEAALAKRKRIRDAITANAVATATAAQEKAMQAYHVAQDARKAALAGVE